MAEKKITRKVISPSKKDRPVDEKAPVKEVKESVEKVTAETEKAGSSRVTGDAGRLKKVCNYCQSKTNPSYTDMVVLKRYVTDRAQIVPRSKNNLCSKHQRFATRQIKYARHLALLPFTPKV